MAYNEIQVKPLKLKYESVFLHKAATSTTSLIIFFLVEKKDFFYLFIFFKHFLNGSYTVLH